MGTKLILGEKTMIDADGIKDGANNHICVIGGSGRGKSHSIVKPNILSWGMDASMIISDPKGALEKGFSSYMKSNGYKVYSLDLIHPEDSAYGYLKRMETLIILNMR